MSESDPRMPATQHTPEAASGTGAPPTERDAESPARAVAPTLTTPLCPYCGDRVAEGPEATRCSSCKGMLDPLSRQATQNAMGPWMVRDGANPYGPGCSFDTVRALVARGRIRRDTVVRGPTTRQFWMFAANTPGVAVLLGECHACHHAAGTDEYLCAHCGAVLMPQTERQTLGLAPVRLLPGLSTAPAIAASAMRPSPHAPPIEVVVSPVPATPPALRRGADRGNTKDPGPIGAASPASALAHRRRRDRVQALTIGLTIAVIAVGTLMVLLVVMAIHNADGGPDAGAGAQDQADAGGPVSAAPVSVNPAEQRMPSASLPAIPERIGAPSAPPREARPTVAGLPIDVGLEAWHGAIERAAALEATDVLADLDRAIEILDGVMREATGAEGRDARSFPILAARISALRERSASMHARGG